MRKVIFDTDIGDDIDDAFALALLANIPEAELLGVTTVFRNTAQRAQLAQTLLAAAKKPGVPVYAGERLPLREPVRPFENDADVPPEQADLCQWSADYAALPVRGGAVDFLCESAERWGAGLTIFSVGPMTNLARAAERAPAAMKRVGAVYAMGGCFSHAEPEWNILCDPEAADIVYRSGMPLYAVGLDVTLQCGLENDLLDCFRASPRAENKLLTLWLERWFRFFGFEKSVMHDPLAVAAAFRPLCTFERVYAKIDLRDARGAVLTSPSPREGYAPVCAAAAVSRAEFYDFVKERLL